MEDEGWRMKRDFEDEKREGRWDGIENILLWCVVRWSFVSIDMLIFQPSKFRKKSENDSNEEENQRKTLTKYLKTLDGTNFFFLYFLSRNVDFRFLQDLLKQISKEM